MPYCLTKGEPGKQESLGGINFGSIQRRSGNPVFGSIRVSACQDEC